VGIVKFEVKNYVLLVSYALRSLTQLRK